MGIGDCTISGFDPDVEGEQEITVSYGGRGGKSVTFTVYVYSADNFVPVEGISLNKTAVTIEAGGSETLAAVIDPEDASEKRVRWTSDNPALAAVNAYGVINVPEDAEEGTVTITVTTIDGGLTAACVVTVTTDGEPVQNLENLTVSLTAGDGKVTLAPQTAAAGFAFYYNKSDASVAAPAYGDAITTITGAVVYTTTTDISGANETAIYVQVYKVETTGNTIVGFGQAYRTPTATPDTAAPVPGGGGAITTASVTTNSLTLNWTKATDDVSAASALRYFVYQKTSAFTMVSGLPTDGTLLNTSGTLDIATFNVSSLLQGTTYFFIVVVEDEAGNRAAYTAKSETTAAVLENLTVNLTAGDGEVTLAAQTAAAGFAFYYNSSAASVAAPAYGAAITTITGATAYNAATDIAGPNGTAIYVQVYKVETTGSTITGFGQANRTPMAAPDTTAPIPGNSGIITTDDVTFDSLTLNWTKASDDETAEANLRYFVYRKTSAFTMSGGLPTDGTLLNSGGTLDIDTYPVTGLSQNTLYFFIVVVEDEAGNRAAYTEVSETTTTAPDTTPPEPGNSGTITTASVTTNSLTLNWTKATDDVSAQSALRYFVYQKTSAFTMSGGLPIDGALLNDFGTLDIATYNVTGLSPTTTYFFIVVVEDEAGNRAAYAEISMTTAAPSSYISTASVDVTIPFNGANPVYTASSGDPTQYSAVVTQWWEGGSAGSLVGATPLTSSDTFVTGQTYVVAVQLTAESGYAFDSSLTCTINTVSAYLGGVPSTTAIFRAELTAEGPPAAPVNLAATPGDAEVTLTWNAPSDGGSPITGYEYRYNSGSWNTIPSSPTSYTVTGLTNETTYTFEIRAVNANGPGAISTIAAKPVLIVTAPHAPTGFIATPESWQVNLAWSTPSNGGSPITRYEYSYNPTLGYAANWNIIPGSNASTTSYTVGGLSNGTNYTFEVRAINAEGNGDSSLTATATPTSPYSLSDGVILVVGGTDQVLQFPDLYLVSGVPSMTGSLGTGGCTAQFDAVTGTLSLHGYNEGTIQLLSPTKEDITIKLIGSNRVTVSGSGQKRGIYSMSGGDIVITSDSGGTLDIDVSSTDNHAIGIVSGYAGGITTGNVIIRGDASVTVDVSSPVDYAMGIYAEQRVCIIEDAAFSVEAKSPSSGFLGAHGIFSEGSATFNTTGNITLDCSDPGNSAGHVVNAMGMTTLMKTGVLTIKWPTGGGPFAYSTPWYNPDHFTVTNPNSNEVVYTYEGP